MNRLKLLLSAFVCLFITALLYTLERIATFTRWNAQISTGTWPEAPTVMDILSQNWFIPLFGFAAILLFFMAGNAAEETTTTKTGTADL